MKKLFIILFALIFFSAAESQPVLPRSSSSVTAADARLKALKNFYVPNYYDTTDANIADNLGIDSCGAIIFTYVNNSLWLRICSPNRWSLWQGGSGGTFDDTVYVADDLYVTWEDVNNNGILKQVIHRLHNDGLVSGGVVTWSGTGLKFYISPAVYYINQTRYESAYDSVTLDPSDLTFGRIDAFVVDTIPGVDKITGTAASNPATPPWNPISQIVVATILLNAGDLTPSNVFINKIYDENVEWATSTVNTITANFNDLNNPFINSKAIYVSSYNSGARLYFIYSQTETVDEGEVLTMYIYSNGKFNNQFRIQFLTNFTLSSNSIVFNSGYGFNPNDSNRYQIVSIPLAAFTWLKPTFNQLAIIMVGTDNSGSKGYYVDNIFLQKGLNNIPALIDYSNKLDSVTMVKTTVGADTSNFFRQWVKGIPKTIGTVWTGGAAAAGGTNLNIGTGYRWAVPGTNNIKTVVNGYAIGIDSASNTNALTFKLDTSLALTKLQAANLYQPHITLTTTGTSGVSTFNGTILNIPNYTTDISGKLNISDTAAMLSPYLRTFIANATFYNSITGLADSSGFIINRPNGTKDTIQVSITPIDTANKWVNRVTKNATGDSFYIWKGTGYTALKDSTGGGGGGSAALTFTQIGVGDASNVLTGHSNFTYEPTPAIVTATALAFKINPNLTSVANGNILIGINVAPVYSTGAHTGVRKWDIKTSQDILINSVITAGFGNGNINTNTAFGSGAINGIATGGENAAFGKNALLALTGGANNSAFGSNSLDVLTTGGANSAFGINTLTSSNASQNSAFGNSSQLLNTTGTANSAFGENSLRANLSGVENVAVGVYSLGSNTGSNNSALGTYSGLGNLGGNNNVFLGYSSMYATTTGSDNVAAGHRAGYNNGAGSRNIYLGRGAAEAVPGLSDRLWIGNSITANAAGIGYDFVLRTGGINMAGYTARWHLPGGQLGASTAPLKFTYTSLATTAATGTGGAATLTFAAQTYIPFPVGSQIVVAGVTPTGYNGTFTVTASTTTTVTWSSATTGAQTVAGTITVGQLQTTAEAGAVEYDGTNFYGTNSTATRYTLAKTLTNTATLDFPSTASGVAADLTITVTGALDGDAVSIGVPNASVTATGQFTAWVSATNTVTIRYIPHATEDPASGVFRASVIRY